MSLSRARRKAAKVTKKVAKKVAKKRSAPVPVLTFTVKRSEVNLEFYFNVASLNHEIGLQSEGYKNQADALHMIDLLKKHARTAKVVIVPLPAPVV